MHLAISSTSTVTPPHGRATQAKRAGAGGPGEGQPVHQYDSSVVSRNGRPPGGGGAPARTERLRRSTKPTPRTMAPPDQSSIAGHAEIHLLRQSFPALLRTVDICRLAARSSEATAQNPGPASGVGSIQVNRLTGQRHGARVGLNGDGVFLCVTEIDCGPGRHAAGSKVPV